MPTLPARATIDHLRAQAQVLSATRHLSAADAEALVARSYGFDDWSRLATEVDRRDVLDRCDVVRLEDLLARRPELAVEQMRPWADHPEGAAPLNYVAMLRYDTSAKLWRDVPGTADLTRALIAAGAPVDGSPEESETPLMTAASYGDAGVALVMIEAGADLERTASPDAGGVPGGTALAHAAVFGNTAVLDLLVAAGARTGNVGQAAAAGDTSGWDLAAATPQELTRALVMAADHQRLPVIDQLIAAGTAVDAVDETWGRQPLRVAARNGRPASVRRLLDHGADPRLVDEDGLTALDLCRAGAADVVDRRAHAEVEAVLEGRNDGRSVSEGA